MSRSRLAEASRVTPVGGEDRPGLREKQVTEMSNAWRRVFGSRAAAKLPQPKKGQVLGSRWPFPRGPVGKGKPRVCTPLICIGTEAHHSTRPGQSYCGCHGQPRHSLSLTSKHGPALSLGCPDPRQALLTSQPILSLGLLPLPGPRLCLLWSPSRVLITLL